jgi:hypothetical protein
MPRVPARATGGGGAAGALAAGAGRDASGAGLLGAGSACTAGGVTGCATAGPLYSGGSSRKVYSRVSLPPVQVSSTSMSRKGSFIARGEETLSANWPPGRRSTSKRKSNSALFKSMLACRNASWEASAALSDSASPGCTATTSISARNGWPRYDCTLSLPSPAAEATDDRSSHAGSASHAGNSKREGARRDEVSRMDGPARWFWIVVKTYLPTPPPRAPGKETKIPS